MKSIPKFILLTLLAIGAACASASDPSWFDRTYRFRATLGPPTWEKTYAFSRGGLSIRATGETDGGTLRVHFHVQNLGGTRVSFAESNFTIRGGSPPRPFPVEIRNSSDIRAQRLTVLARDELRFSVVSIQPLTLVDGALVLEARGIRDDANDGGYDFDLFGEPVPEEEAGSKGTRKPKPTERDGRRDIRDSNSIETPTKTG